MKHNDNYCQLTILGFPDVPSLVYKRHLLSSEQNQPINIVVSVSSHRLRRALLAHPSLPSLDIPQHLYFIELALGVSVSPHRIRPSDEYNIITALEHPDRVCRVGLSVTGAQLAKMSAAIQQPFPVLTYLSFSTKSETGLVLCSRFLGPFASCLQELHLSGIAFPPSLTLLLSTSNLVELSLCNIARTGYTSLDAMLAYLAALPMLKALDIAFNSYSDRIPLHPIIRSVLPSPNSNSSLAIPSI